MLSVFLAGSWRENRLQFFGSSFLFIFRSFRQIGWAELWDGSAELLQRFPGGFLRENAAFWSRFCFYNPLSLPFGYVRVLVISGSCWLFLLIRSLCDLFVKPKAKCPEVTPWRGLADVCLGGWYYLGEKTFPSLAFSGISYVPAPADDFV